MPARAESAIAAAPAHRRTAVIGAALLAALVLVVYAPAAQFGFLNYDDPRYVTGPPQVRAGLTWETWRWAFGRTEDNWHPLTSLSHAAVWQLGGPHPAPHHLVNVALHAANAALVVVVLTAFTGAPWLALVAAALFALHPLRVESVAWVTERKDVLSGLGFLLTLWAYVAWVRRPTALRAGGVMAAFVAALLAKSMVVTTPLVLLLLDVWPLARREPLARRVREKAPLFVLAGLAGVATVLAQRHGSMTSFETLPLGARAANAVVASVRYLGATVWPVDLAFFYPYRYWPPAVVAAAGATIVAITVAVLVERRRRPYLAVGWLWWLVMLVPVSGLVQVGEQSMADRYTYLPSLGLGIAVVWGGAELARSRSATRALAALVVVVLVASTWATRRQLWTWESSETLARHAIAVTRGNYQAHVNLGQALAASRDDTGAEEQYQLAYAIRPDYPQTLVNLGLSALRAGRPDDAEAWFRRALAVRADYALALNGMGRVSAAREDHPGAIVWYDRALAADPGGRDARANRADALAALGRTAEAIAVYRGLVTTEPSFGFELGNLLFRAGETEEAIAAWRISLAAAPRWNDARDNVAVALLVLDRPADAIVELEQIVAVDADHGRAQLHLGLALARVGRRPEAIAALRRARALRPDDPEAERQLAALESAP